MTLETLIAAAVERGVLAAMAKLPVATSPAVTPCAGHADEQEKAEVADKKPAKPKKPDAAPAADIPPPAPAPTTVKAPDIEAARATLASLASKLPNGRKLAGDMIRAHGVAKIDELSAEALAAVIDTMTKLAAEATENV